MTVGGIEVEISHPDKELFPGAGLSKADLAKSYERIAGAMLANLEGRPISMEHYPNGIEAEGFYQKKVQEYFPQYVHRVTVDLREGESQEQVACNNAATLVFFADQGCIMPQAWLSREGRLERPDRLVFDLDPPGDDFGAVRQAAGALRELLHGIGLPSYPMPTGSKGLHVQVPLDGKAGFDTTRELGQNVERNAYGQTAVPPYAVRARKGAPVAVPIDWDGLSSMQHSNRYSIRNLLRRLGRKDDPWRGMDAEACSAASALERLKELNQENRS